MKDRLSPQVWSVFVLCLLMFAHLLPVSAAPAQQGGAPEINVRDGATNIPDNTGSVTFPATTVGNPASKTFSVQNTGTANLTAANMTLPAGFTLTAVNGPTTIAPGGTTTFTIRCNAASAGTFSGQLSFTNNDANENPYNFTISCTVNGGGGTPEINVRQGTTNIADGSGSVNFGTTTVGTPISRTFNVQNTGTGTLSISAPSLPAGFALNGISSLTVAPGGSATFTVRCTATSAGTFSGQVSLTNNDANENPYNFSISCTVNGGGSGAPEINVRDGATNIPDGSGSVNFGTTNVGSPVSKTFTVQNTGNAALTIASPSVPAGFSVTGLSGTTVPAGGSATFGVRCNAASAGTFSGQLSFTNNDANENPYNFAISCTVNGGGSSAPEVNVYEGAFSIADNTGSVNFGTTSVGSPISRTFGIENTGNAPLTIANLTVPSGFTVTAAPAATVPAGGSTSFTVRCDATVARTNVGELSFTNNDANENPYNFTISCVVNPPGAPEIEVRTEDGAVIPDNTGSAPTITVPEGWTTSIVLRVHNLGTANLTVGTPTFPAGFSYHNASPWGTTTIAPGTSTTLTIDCNGDSVGTYSGELSFSNNDADENPYNFTVTCNVETAVREIDIVRLSGAQIPDNTGSLIFRNTTVGSPVVEVIQIRSTGNVPLDLSAPTLPAGFSANLGFSRVPPGSHLTMLVRCQAETAGVFTGEFSLPNNDPDENPYNFTLSCTVVEPEPSPSNAIAGDNVVAEPPVTEEPVVTEEPTQAPVVTEEPVVTEAPTEAPVITEEPVVTEAPTEAPVVTEAPTEIPTEVSTEAPVITEAPPTEEVAVGEPATEQPSEAAPEATAEAG